ncbi:MAG: MFS transporter [Proteobacteria bacterium]|nr:MFS transporter [Pseudomonadota bacterium]
MKNSSDDKRKIAFQFILLMGVVSLFGDITYEGARSITGPYMAMLGATAGIVGLVAGIGEFSGYALRLLSGYFADRTRAYWPLTIAGYGLILAIPLMALANNWQAAAVLVILERMGKAIRSPARDAILSHATKQVGRGWGFGIHEAMDQIGAIAGPLIFTAVIIFKGNYRTGFNILWVPAFLTLAMVIAARMKVPSPEKLEQPDAAAISAPDGSRLPKVFWLYAVFIFLSVGGFAHFQIISYHLKIRAVVSDAQIPLFYAIAMGVDGVVALIIGKAYDKVGLKTLVSIPLLTLLIPFFAFSSSYGFALFGIIWGSVMGIHETVMRAAIADLIPIARRGAAYGIFNTVYGVSFLVGSAVMGFLYDKAPGAISGFVVLLEVVSVPILFAVLKELRHC